MGKSKIFQEIFPSEENEFGSRSFGGPGCLPGRQAVGLFLEVNDVRLHLLHIVRKVGVEMPFDPPFEEDGGGDDLKTLLRLGLIGGLDSFPGLGPCPGKQQGQVQVLMPGKKPQFFPVIENHRTMGDEEYFHEQLFR